LEDASFYRCGTCNLFPFTLFFFLSLIEAAVYKKIFNFLSQDHVAATFGAGLGVACVVDVGDQKTSVSCVEDGISHRNTRVNKIRPYLTTSGDPLEANFSASK